MESPAHAVIETHDFIVAAKRLLSEAERLALIDEIAFHPTKGVIIKETGGARKLRWARPGHGKSDGYRVVYFFHGPDVPVFLLDIFAKNEKVNLSKAERNDLRSILAALARSYVTGVREHVRSRKKTD
jgi:hypothetical protein